MCLQLSRPQPAYGNTENALHLKWTDAAHGCQLQNNSSNMYRGGVVAAHNSYRLRKIGVDLFLENGGAADGEGWDFGGRTSIKGDFGRGGVQLSNVDFTYDKK